jgi:hypothetical protein
MTGTPLILLLYALATMAMTGLIWFVQVVHSPLLHRIAARAEQLGTSRGGQHGREASA